MLELSFLLCESSVKVHGTKAYVQKALPLTGVEVAVTTAHVLALPPTWGSISWG